MPVSQIFPEGFILPCSDGISFTQEAGYLQFYLIIYLLSHSVFDQIPAQNSVPYYSFMREETYKCLTRQHPVKYHLNRDSVHIISTHDSVI